MDWNLVRTRLPEHIRNPDPNIYRSNNYVTLDFETTTIGKGLSLYPDNGIVLSAWENGPDHPRPGLRAHWGGEFTLDELVRDIEDADFLVCHNAKFELGWLRRCGLNLATVIVWDTMIGEYVIGGNRWVWKQLSLEASGQRRLGEGKHNVISKMFKAGLCSTEIPSSWLKSYCIQDVLLCRKLFVEQRRFMLEDGMLMPVMFTRCLATPVLCELELNGMYLDTTQVSELCMEKELEYAEVQNKLEEVTGGININSTKQLREFLYNPTEITYEHVTSTIGVPLYDKDGSPVMLAHPAGLGFDEVKDRKGKELRTGSGLQRTDADTIQKLKARTSDQRVFLELYVRSKELYNELTKYLRKFRDCCEEVGGRLQAQFNQTNTRTHRLSSSGLDYSTQFQNFPRAYKPLFRAERQGWLVGEADGAQLEFRVAAHLGRDKVALGDIIGGTDIHSVTADIIGCSRQDAKPHTFKPLYGGRSGTPDEVRYYEFFREKYVGVTNTQRSWINSVLSDKELRTEWGMKYYWPDTRQDRSGYVTNSTSICNYPVQAFATAEIIPVGLVYFWHYARAAELQMKIVNTVHDSIITELPPEELEEFHELAQISLIDEVYLYLRSVYDIELVVPLGAGVMTGSHWSNSEAKDSEVTYTAKETQYERI